MPVLHIDLGIFKKLADLYEELLALVDRWYSMNVDPPADIAASLLIAGNDALIRKRENC